MKPVTDDVNRWKLMGIGALGVIGIGGMVGVIFADALRRIGLVIIVKGYVVPLWLEDERAPNLILVGALPCPLPFLHSSMAVTAGLKPNYAKIDYDFQGAEATSFGLHGSPQRLCSQRHAGPVGMRRP